MFDEEVEAGARRRRREAWTVGSVLVHSGRGKEEEWAEGVGGSCGGGGGGGEGGGVRGLPPPGTGCFSPAMCAAVI